MNTSLNIHRLGKTTSDTGERLANGCRLVLLGTAVMTILTVGSVVMLIVAMVTLFRSRRFYREVMLKWIGRAVLRACGIRLIVHMDEPLPEKQTVYISNHTSVLDGFILAALGLPNARFFMWGPLRRIVPVGLIGYVIGIFWTAPQELPEKRRNIFRRAGRVLQRTGESVYLSPEGRRVTTGRIAHFNMGAFHLATNLGAPILPIYVATPRHMDPGTGYDLRPGTVHVYFKTPIPTRDWKIEDLVENRKMVRNLFVELNEELQAA